MRKYVSVIFSVMLVAALSFLVLGCDQSTTSKSGKSESKAKTGGNEDKDLDSGEDEGENENKEEESKVEESSYVPGNGPRVEMETSKGKIVMELFPDVAPKTVESFKSLTAKKFYDGLTFHRYVPDFVIQGGDPKGDGTGGPGYTVPAEFNDRKHIRGALAMARSSDPNSAGSQFYMVLNEDTARQLDGQYTVFGQVIEGMENVDKLRAGDTMNTVVVHDAAELQ